MKLGSPKRSWPAMAAKMKLTPMTTRPMMALEICFWAFSDLAESPPAVMMAKPPRTN